MTTIQLFQIENSWCFLNVCVKQNNTYWIDWVTLCDINEDTPCINLELFGENNILCFKDNDFQYYNAVYNQTYKLSNMVLSLCVDGIKNLSDLNVLQDKYNMCEFQLFQLGL
jgi:hypothetical protein